MSIPMKVPMTTSLLSDLGMLDTARAILGAHAQPIYSPASMDHFLLFDLAQLAKLGFDTGNTGTGPAESVKLPNPGDRRFIVESRVGDNTVLSARCSGTTVVDSIDEFSKLLVDGELTVYEEHDVDRVVQSILGNPSIRTTENPLFQLAMRVKDHALTMHRVNVVVSGEFGNTMRMHFWGRKEWVNMRWWKGSEKVLLWSTDSEYLKVTVEATPATIVAEVLSWQK